jgi:hypothetical protein
MERWSKNRAYLNKNVDKKSITMSGHGATRPYAHLNTHFMSEGTYACIYKRNLSKIILRLRL